MIRESSMGKSLFQHIMESQFKKLLRKWYTYGCLYKFMKEKHAISTREGIYRLNSSELYSDRDLTKAQQDNENEKRIKIAQNPSTFMIGENLHIIEDENTMILPAKVNPYYLSSLTLDITNRLYKDFGTDEIDTALIITDIPEFIRRLHLAAKKKGLYIISAPVRYRGISIPFGHGAIFSCPPFDKDTKYKYQKEFRVVIPEAKEDWMELELKLSDISVLLPEEELLCEIKIVQSFFDEFSKEAWIQMKQESDGVFLDRNAVHNIPNLYPK